MAELKRNTDFATDTARARVDPRSMEALAQRRDDRPSPEAGFDPYNHVGSQALKPHAV